MTDNNIIYAVIFSTLIILLLIAGVAITIFISNKQRAAQDMKMAQMQVDYEREMRIVQNEVQEQVMTNVGRELHDNIGQLLTVMHIQLEQNRIMMHDEAESLKPIHDTLNSVTEQVRLLGRSLNSELLEQNGLLKMMQMEADRLMQLNHVALHWVNDNTEPVLNKDQRLMAFRIFQEMLNNTLKHAAARQINITLTGKGKFSLIVQDDGKGFDVNETLATGKGSGLRNMMKRAALSDLAFSIVAETGKGSTFTLEQTNKRTS